MKTKYVFRAAFSNRDLYIANTSSGLPWMYTCILTNSSYACYERNSASVRINTRQINYLINRYHITNWYTYMSIKVKLSDFTGKQYNLWVSMSCFKPSDRYFMKKKIFICAPFISYTCFMIQCMCKICFNSRFQWCLLTLAIVTVKSLFIQYNGQRQYSGVYWVWSRNSLLAVWKVS